MSDRRRDATDDSTRRRRAPAPDDHDRPGETDADGPDAGSTDAGDDGPDADSTDAGDDLDAGSTDAGDDGPDDGRSLLADRRLLGALAVGVLLLSAGCTGIFGGGISDEQLDETPPGGGYDWNTSQDVTVTVLDGKYTTVYDLNGTAELRLFTRGFSTDDPLSFRSLRYRYPNGTVINGSAPAVEVSTEGDRRVVRVPDAAGRLAYTSGMNGKQFGTPGYVEGTYEVVLPPNTRTSSFLFGDVSPGGYTATVDDQSRLHLVWSEPVSNGVFVRFYLQRDVLIFRGLFVGVVLLGGTGLLYVYRQIQKLREQREELGLDVDTDDDLGGGGPPPGMR